MRYLSIFALLVSASSLASASTLAFSCVPNNNNAVTNSALVLGGATSVTCDGFSAPAGSLITNISFNFLATFQDSVDNGNHQLTFSGNSAYGGFGPGTTTSHPSVGFMVASGGGAQAIANTGGNWIFNVATSNTLNVNVLPDNASYTISGVYTYEVQDGQVPEPSTLALVGGVLVLAGIRKFRS